MSAAPYEAGSGKIGLPTLTVYVFHTSTGICPNLTVAGVGVKTNVAAGTVGMAVAPRVDRSGRDGTVATPAVHG